MSQHAIPAPYPQYVMVPMRESNGLGVAGFFIALIGLFIPTGIVALLGLLISLVALGRAPRGFATMGVLVGLFGTVVWLAITGVAILGALAVGVTAVAGIAAAFVLTNPEIVEVTADMANVTIAAVEYENENGALPEGLEDLGLSTSTLTDPWGNPYRYIIVEDDPGFDVVSSGSDGIMGTEDDMALSRINRVWEDAIESFGDKVDDLGDRMEQLQGSNVRFQRTSARGGWVCGQAPKRCDPATIIAQIRAEITGAVAEQAPGDGR